MIEQLIAEATECDFKVALEPNEADICKACSCVKPYRSAKAATTDCEQLYPSLKYATARAILSSLSFISFQWIDLQNYKE